MAPRASWAADFFYPKRQGDNDYRFCRLCWPQAASMPSSEQVRNCMGLGEPPSSKFIGCCKHAGSPGAMVNHIKAAHPEVLPPGVPSERVA
eukprot:780445-Karenia_brevis.AAC.1